MLDQLERRELLTQSLCLTLKALKGDAVIDGLELTAIPTLDLVGDELRFALQLLHDGGRRCAIAAHGRITQSLERTSA